MVKMLGRFLGGDGMMGELMGGLMVDWWWTDGELMVNWWWTDDGMMGDLMGGLMGGLMVDWWWTDGELMGGLMDGMMGEMMGELMGGLMVDWWWTDDGMMGELMVNWWWTDGWTDGGLMVDWWWTDGELMVNWWWTDGGLMVDWWWTDGGLMGEVMVNGRMEGRWMSEWASLDKWLVQQKESVRECQTCLANRWSNWWMEWRTDGWMGNNKPATIAIVTTQPLTLTLTQPLTLTLTLTLTVKLTHRLRVSAGHPENPWQRETVSVHGGGVVSWRRQASACQSARHWNRSRWRQRQHAQVGRLVEIWMVGRVGIGEKSGMSE